MDKQMLETLRIGMVIGARTGWLAHAARDWGDTLEGFIKSLENSWETEYGTEAEIHKERMKEGKLGK